MGKTFATTSGKGGVGKSSIAVGLSTALCALGKSVLLVDMDEGLRCLDLLLGIDGTTVLDLCDAMENGDIKGVAYGCGIPNLSLIPAPLEAGRIEGERLSVLAKKAEELYDVIIYDFPAGLDFSYYNCLPKGTVFLTVATADPVSVRGAAAVSRLLEKENLHSRLIINKFNLKNHRRNNLLGIDGIIDTANLRLVGIVPESDELLKLALRHSIKKHSRVYKAFLRIANRLLDKENPLPKAKKI